MNQVTVDELLVFTGLMALLGSITRIVLTALRRKAGTPPEALVAQLRELSARLERVEHTVDATALEVERVAEGQRFVTKVMAERSPALPEAAERRSVGRVATPR